MDLARVGLITVGGYFILKYMGIDLLQGVTEVPVEGAENGSSINEPTNGDANQGAEQTIFQAMIARAEQGRANSEGWLTGFNGLLNFDQWNWVYSQIRGIDGPAPEDVGFDKPREYKMTIDEWFGWASKSGLSGIESRIASVVRSGGPTFFERANKRFV